MAAQSRYTAAPTDEELFEAYEEATRFEKAIRLSPFNFLSKSLHEGFPESLMKARKPIPGQLGLFAGGTAPNAHGGPYIGPRGGKWADPQHTIPWEESASQIKAGSTVQLQHKGKAENFAIVTYSGATGRVVLGSGSKRMEVREHDLKNAMRSGNLPVSAIKHAWEKQPAATADEEKTKPAKKPATGAGGAGGGGAATVYSSRPMVSRSLRAPREGEQIVQRDSSPYKIGKTIHATRVSGGGGPDGHYFTVVAASSHRISEFENDTREGETIYDAIVRPASDEQARATAGKIKVATKAKMSREAALRALTTGEGQGREWRMPAGSQVIARDPGRFGSMASFPFMVSDPEGGVYHIRPVYDDNPTVTKLPMSLDDALKTAKAAGWTPEKPVHPSRFEKASRLSPFNLLIKAGYPVGTIRQWRGGSYQKKQSGEWVAVKQALQPHERGLRMPFEQKPAPETGRQLSARLAELTAGQSVRQTSSSIDEIYASAAAANDRLVAVTHTVAKQTGGYPVTAPLKGRTRAMEKLQTLLGDDGRPDPARLTDIARASIKFDSIDGVYNALDAITKEVEVVRFKDRFRKPAGGGYRDILMNVRLHNGHVAELQLHVSDILDVKNGEGHKLYEQSRTIAERAEKENRPFTRKEALKIAKLAARQQELYDRAYEKALKRSAA